MCGIVSLTIAYTLFLYITDVRAALFLHIL